MISKQQQLQQLNTEKKLPQSLQKSGFFTFKEHQFELLDLSNGAECTFEEALHYIKFIDNDNFINDAISYIKYLADNEHINEDTKIKYFVILASGTKFETVTSNKNVQKYNLEIKVINGKCFIKTNIHQEQKATSGRESDIFLGKFYVKFLQIPGKNSNVQQLKTLAQRELQTFNLNGKKDIFKDCIEYYKEHIREFSNVYNHHNAGYNEYVLMHFIWALAFSPDRNVEEILHMILDREDVYTIVALDKITAIFANSKKLINLSEETDTKLLKSVTTFQEEILHPLTQKDVCNTMKNNVCQSLFIIYKNQGKLDLAREYLKNMSKFDFVGNVRFFFELLSFALLDKNKALLNVMKKILGQQKLVVNKFSNLDELFAHETKNLFSLIIEDVLSGNDSNIHKEKILPCYCSLQSCGEKSYKETFFKKNYIYAIYQSYLKSKFGDQLLDEQNLQQNIVQNKQPQIQEQFQEIEEEKKSSDIQQQDGIPQQKHLKHLKDLINQYLLVKKSQKEPVKQQIIEKIADKQDTIKIYAYTILQEYNSALGILENYQGNKLIQVIKFLYNSLQAGLVASKISSSQDLHNKLEDICDKLDEYLISKYKEIKNTLLFKFISDENKLLGLTSQEILGIGSEELAENPQLYNVLYQLQQKANQNKLVQQQVLYKKDGVEFTLGGNINKAEFDGKVAIEFAYKQYALLKNYHMGQDGQVFDAVIKGVVHREYGQNGFKYYPKHIFDNQTDKQLPDGLGAHYIKTSIDTRYDQEAIYITQENQEIIHVFDLKKGINHTQHDAYISQNIHQIPVYTLVGQEINHLDELD